jgi:hypothetical protein
VAVWWGWAPLVIRVPALMTVTGFDSDDLSALEIAITGGAPCPLPVLEYFQGKGVPFQGQAFFSCADARLR